MLALFRFHLGMLPTLGGAALLGLLLQRIAPLLQPVG
jgi:hypothetical protein